MSNYDQIGILCDKAEKLVSVQYSVFDAGLDGKDWIEAVEMRFEDTFATIYVETEFDTLRLELGEMKVGLDCYVKPATSFNPWRRVLGRTLSWMWILKNQQGYEDGFRLEFSTTQIDKTSRIITLIGMASSIRIFLSKEINLQ